MIEFSLRGNAANCVLLDTTGFSNFKAGRSFKFVGGLAKQSPIQLTVPRAGRWYAVVLLPPGTRGHVNASVAKRPGPMPVLRPAASASPQIQSIAASASAYGAAVGLGLSANDREWDAFISHAGEDKVQVVLPLAQALIQRGVRVWLDIGELRIGSNLRQEIDRGIAKSRFGIVILSEAFFAARWPQAELDGLVTREMVNGQQIILPIRHGIDTAGVAKYSPTLANRFARRWSPDALDAIADEITAVVGVSSA